MESKVMSLVGQNITMQAHPFSREWLVSFKDPVQLWSDNWFALVLEVASALILFQLFRNAKNKDPHLAYLLLTAVMATTCFEILPIIPRPGYQLWWYHQGVINILKQRVPSYVISVFALVFYMAHSLTNRSKLPSWTRSVVTAVSATLIMLPCLWMASRLLLTVMHFDDPVFRDGIRGVPYIQLVLIMLLCFHTSHLFNQNFAEIEPSERNAYSYTKCSLQSGLVAAIYALIEQYMLYILFSLTLGANTGVCLAFAVLVLIYLAKQEIQEMQMTSYSIQGILSPLMRKELWVVVAALAMLSSLPLWLNVHDLKSTSDRLELGPCHVIHEVANTSPLEIPRRRYVCPDDTSVLNFDFHCISKKELIQGVKNKTSHYSICGKRLENPQLITRNLLTYSTCCLVLFYVVMLFSFTFKVQEKKIEDECKTVE